MYSSICQQCNSAIVEASSELRLIEPMYCIVSDEQHRSTTLRIYGFQQFSLLVVASDLMSSSLLHCPCQSHAYCCVVISLLFILIIPIVDNANCVAWFVDQLGQRRLCFKPMTILLVSNSNCLSCSVQHIISRTFPKNNLNEIKNKSIFYIFVFIN